MCDVDGDGGDGEVGEGHQDSRDQHGPDRLAGEEAGAHLALLVLPEVELGPGGRGDGQAEDEDQRAAVTQTAVHQTGQTAGVEDRDEGAVEEISLQYWRL